MKLDRKIILRRVWKITKRLLLSLVAFFALFFLFSWLLTIIPVNSDFAETKNGLAVYLRSNGMHVDVCFSKSDVKKYLDSKSFELDADYIEYYSFGWGDKGFYIETPTWDDLKYSTAAYALFWPSPTAMHVTYLYEQPQEGEKVKKVNISENQLKNMLSFIDESFEKLSSGRYKKIEIENDYYANIDEFFEADGSYCLFYTCNTWTNECIKSGGIKTAVWAPFEWSVLYHFE